MNLQSKLSELGFTEYEAKVYLALLDESPATGYQISKQAGVPRSMVYEALGRLKGRGAVLETPDERATLYRPLPPDVLLAALRLRPFRDWPHRRCHWRTQSHLRRWQPERGIRENAPHQCCRCRQPQRGIAGQVG